MNYSFQFSEVLRDPEELLFGALLTLRLSALAMVLGLLVAVACAVGKSAGPRPVRWLVSAYIELIRNTPFLVQIFLIFFGLPAIGLRMSANSAALAAMVVNVGAYAAEIVRAGIEAIPRGQIEAARALGLHRTQVFRHIVLFQAIRTVFPALSGQFILLMLGSSVVSSIAAEELTAIANNIQSRTFRSFEIYIVVTGIYLAMSILLSGVFAFIYRQFLQRQDRPGGRAA